MGYSPSRCTDHLCVDLDPAADSNQTMVPACRPSKRSSRPARDPRFALRPVGAHDAERACLDLETHHLQVQDHHTGRIRVVGMNDKTRVPQVRARLLAKPADDRHPAVGPLVIDQHFPAQVMIEMDLVPRLLQQARCIARRSAPTPHPDARPGTSRRDRGRRPGTGAGA